MATSLYHLTVFFGKPDAQKRKKSPRSTLGFGSEEKRPVAAAPACGPLPFGRAAGGRRPGNGQRGQGPFAAQRAPDLGVVLWNLRPAPAAWAPARVGAKRPEGRRGLGRLAMLWSGT